MIVFAQQLLNAAADLRQRDVKLAKLKEPVTVSPEQLETAGVILRDGPQPIANGIKSDMPGFIHPERQEGDVLVLDVGILPTWTHRIARDGGIVPDQQQKAVA